MNLKGTSIANLPKGFSSYNWLDGVFNCTRCGAEVDLRAVDFVRHPHSAHYRWCDHCLREEKEVMDECKSFMNFNKGL